MELNSQQLEEIERIAAAAYSPMEVALMLGLPCADFLTEVGCHGSAGFSAYFKGFFSSEYAVRVSQMQLARNGSSPAQTSATNLFNETRINIYKQGISLTAED